MGAPAAAAGAEDRRKRGIKAIKAAQRQMGLDDAAYRALLIAQTGKASATELTLHEQTRVLDYMRAHGAAHPRAAERAGGRKRGTPSAEKAAMLRALHALLSELETITGEPHTMNYLDAICRRNGWAERVDFCAPADLHKLVGAVARTMRSKAAGRPVAP